MTDDELGVLNFKVSTRLKDRLRRYAGQNGLSMSAAIRLLLTQALDREERRAKPQ